MAITTRRDERWISIPKLVVLPEPGNLQAVKDADFLTEFSTEFSSVASRAVIDRDTPRCAISSRP
jgi:hypothetical protein